VIRRVPLVTTVFVDLTSASTMLLQGAEGLISGQVLVSARARSVLQMDRHPLSLPLSGSVQLLARANRITLLLGRQAAQASSLRLCVLLASATMVGYGCIRRLCRRRMANSLLRLSPAVCRGMDIQCMSDLSMINRAYHPLPLCNLTARSGGMTWSIAIRRLEINREWCVWAYVDCTLKMHVTV